MKTIHPLCFLLILLTACDDENSSNEIFSNSYLPLQVGNYWKFEGTNKNLPEVYTFKKVNATVTLNDKTYFEVISGWVSPPQSSQDTAYYRVDEDGFVYILQQINSQEENRFRLNGIEGDTWSYPLDDDEATITLSVSTLDLGKKTLKDCKAYYYNVDNWADEENTVTLAKGIGFVKEYSNAWGNGALLKSAIINGRKIDF